MTRGAFAVREAAAHDAPAVCAYLAELFAESPPTLLLRASPRNAEEQQSVIQAYHESASSVFLIALAADQVIGELRFAAAPGERRAHSGGISMAVARSWRGSGVGTALLRALFDWIEKHPSVWRAELEVLSNNPRARLLYERMGFAPEGVRTGAVQIGSEVLDSLIMARLWPRKGAAVR